MNDDSHDDNDAPNGPLDVFITNTTRGFLLPEKEMDVQPPDGAFLEISATGRAPFFFFYMELDVIGPPEEINELPSRCWFCCLPPEENNKVGVGQMHKDRYGLWTINKTETFLLRPAGGIDRLGSSTDSVHWPSSRSDK